MDTQEGGTYTVYRQDVWNGDPAPSGDWWEQFAASCVVQHDGMRESLGGGLECVGETIWWRSREAPLPERQSGDPLY